jgi:hypothetical protein
VLSEHLATPPAMNSHIVMPVSANSAYGVSPDGTFASLPRNTAKIAVRISGCRTAHSTPTAVWR